MSTDRETTRLVRSWLDEGVTRLPDRVLDAVLDQVPATPQRRSWRLAWRFDQMNTYAKLIATAAAVLVVAVVGYQFLPGRSGPGGQTAAPSPSPVPLAVGTFTSHGVATRLDASGAGANVTGTMTVSDEGGRATVALECSRTTADGLTIIAGVVTDSTYSDFFVEGTRVAIALLRGTPVKAFFHFPEGPPPSTCPGFLDIVPDSLTNDVLEPINGSVELAP
jgi:hypothetical protein